MTLPRYAALAAAALSLAGCAHSPTRQAAAPDAPSAPRVEAPAPEARPAAQAAAPIHQPAARPAPTYAPAAPIHQVAARPAPVHAPAPAAPAPVHQLAARPAPPPYAPAPTYAPAAPIHQVAARPAPVYAPAPAAPAPIHAAPAAPESYVAAGPRRLGEMAPVRDRADGQASGGSAAPRRAGRYRTIDGDLSAPVPQELRRVASLGPTAPARGYGFDPGMGPRLVEAARAQTRSPVRYDGAYVKIAYPWGDVPGDTGVCTDVLVRAYRQMGFDFQQMMHEDMRQAFSYYPSAEIYGLKEPDPNIDHRRVVNMEAFLERHAQNLTPTRNPQDYQPGDIVSWRISGTQPHMGIVSDKRDERTGVPYVIHNIGAGVKEENMLFLSPPVGHYRFAPSSGSGPVRTAGL